MQLQHTLLNRENHSTSPDDGSGSQSNFPRLSSRCSLLLWSCSSSVPRRTTENNTVRYTRPVEISLSVYRSSWFFSSTYFMIGRSNPGRRTEKSNMISESMIPIKRANLHLTNLRMPNKDFRNQQHTSSQVQIQTPSYSPRPGNTFCVPRLYQGC